MVLLQDYLQNVIEHQLGVGVTHTHDTPTWPALVQVLVDMNVTTPAGVIVNMLPEIVKVTA